MSALGEERTFLGRAPMSALPLKADIDRWHRQVLFVPKADLTPDHPHCLKRAVFHVLGQRLCWLSNVGLSGSKAELLVQAQRAGQLERSKPWVLYQRQ